MLLLFAKVIYLKHLHSIGKPKDIGSFLSPLTIDLKDCMLNGILIIFLLTLVNDRRIAINGICFLADAPARAMLKGSFIDFYFQIFLIVILNFIEYKQDLYITMANVGAKNAPRWENTTSVILLCFYK